MPTPASWTDRAKVHLEEERSLPMTRPFGELPAMTEPQTAAGRALLESVRPPDRYPLRIVILAIEAEAAAPVAQPAPLDRERLAAAMYDAVNDADQGGPNWSESPGYSHRVWLRNADAVIARLAAADSQPSASEEEA